jgi:DNA-binding beta-propeller fold protein YncE
MRNERIDMRILRTFARCAAGIGLVAMAGCAQAPADFSLTAGVADSNRSLVWPMPPETPRFLYAGELIGEANFTHEEDKLSSGLTRALDWLTGLIAGAADPVTLQRPQAGTVDEEGRIYVTDVSRKAVFVFDERHGKLLLWELVGEKAHFKAPIGIALGIHGEVLVSDAELGMVVRLDHEGNPRGQIGKGILKRPTGLARDAQQGLLYVADTRAHDVKVFDDDGRLVNVIGSQGDREGELNGPTHLAFAEGELYVTDSLNSHVQVYSGNGEMLRRFGQRGLNVGNLVRPKGVALDDEGHVYVVESYFDHMLVFDKDGTLLISIGGNGKEHGQFYLPAGIWTDHRNRIYVADMFNGRVEIFQFLGETS